jgi:hypothetical protein
MRSGGFRPLRSMREFVDSYTSPHLTIIKMLQVRTKLSLCLIKHYVQSSVYFTAIFQHLFTYYFVNIILDILVKTR